MAKSAAVSTSARRVSSETPRHSVPSFDQLVTQWMSTVTESAGRAPSSCHDHVCRVPSSVATHSSHSSWSTCGVGPAESTGKSPVRCCPGGSRSSRSRGRPWKPRVTKSMPSDCTADGPPAHGIRHLGSVATRPRQVPPIRRLGRQDELVTTTVPLMSVSDGVATIRLSRPDTGNALDLPAAIALRDAVGEVASALDRVHVVVLSAEGRLFCAGGDVRAMAAADDRPVFVAELAGVLHEALERLRALPVPVVAVVQGAAAGAGVGLVLAADVVLAAEHATFVAAYPSVGLSPDCGVSALLPAVVGARRAALFLLTGTSVDAATALDWGLVTEVCPAETLDARAGEVVATITALPRRAVGEAARLLRRSGERTYAAQLADEAATIARLSGGAEAGALLESFASPAPRQPTNGATP